MNSILIQDIGKTANDILKSVNELQVTGITSRGIFLRTNTRWILFLSSEKFRGPLTINIPKNKMSLQIVQTGDQLQHLGQKLFLPNSGFELDLQSSLVWEAPNPINVKKKNTRNEIISQLKVINDPLLENILKPYHNEGAGQSSLAQQILTVYSELRMNNFTVVERTAKKMLGSGVGLTPEGDDFLIGLILSLKYSQSNMISTQKEILFSQLTTAAYEKTTQVSANLIECATNGQADERLTDVYFALLTDVHDCSDKINRLLKWGNTSGRMALIGIAVGILSSYQ